MYRSRRERVRIAHHGIMFVALIWSVGILNRFLSRPYVFALVMDSYVSPVARATIQAACSELPRYGRLDVVALRTMLQHSVASVRHVEIDYRNPQRVIIKIMHARPQALINTGLALTGDHALVSTTEYSPVVLEQLPHMTVYEQLHTGEEQSLYLPFLSEVPAEILTEYYIVWIDKTCIKLLSRIDSSIEYYAWHTTRFSPEMIDAMQHIRQKLLATPHMLHKRVKGIWRVDLRVPQYLVVSYAAKERS